MNLQEILAAIEAITKLIDSLKSLGLDLSGVKVVDLLALFKRP